ncbi:MAG TPA: quinone oxidoreductase [Kofleriaceae bacterium]|nr:quinone oxidoreductase [Kofleriaceae bacterium]
MKAIRAHRYGGPEVLTLDELSLPSPGPGQALVAVEHAGVNFIDVYHRTGLYPGQLPLAIGQEGAGVVEAVGPDVALTPGARVAWTGVQGSYATHLLAPADRLVPVPPALSSAQAAAAMLQGMTAHYLTRSTFALGPGHTCLVHAAAGGVGLLLCQLGRRIGARVIGTASTDEKAAAARAAGAATVIRYDQTDFAEEVLRLTGGAGLEVAYDSVGMSTFEGSLRSLAQRGMLVLFGQSSGPVPPIEIKQLAGRSLFLTRPTLGHYTATRSELRARADDVLSWVASGELHLTVDRELPLSRAAEAHQLLEGRRTSGKLLLSTSI